MKYDRYMQVRNRNNRRGVSSIRMKPDAVHKLHGLGSVGTKREYVLVQCTDVLNKLILTRLRPKCETMIESYIKVKLLRKINYVI